jgi:NCS1 family nucleobase:cation symporter-1
LVTSKPAVYSWGAGLILGFGLNALQIMSFYYLFIPTWIFTLILYTFLAKRYGAKEDYTSEEAEEKQLKADILAYQEQKAKLKVPHQKTILYSLKYWLMLR